MKKVGILGSGMVGQTLAEGFKKLGFEVGIGSREGKTIEGWDGKVGKFEEIAKDSELIVLCVKGSAAEDVVRKVASFIKGKTIIDTTNPIEGAPEDNVIKLFTSQNESLMERLTKIAPEANFVKAFNSTGAGTMVNPDYKGVTPSMFICGNNEQSKKEVSQILKDFGWEAEDMGKAAAARPIESLCVLWCIPGFIENSWTHTFKLLKKS